MSELKVIEKYSRVTSILYPFSGLHHIDPLVLENAANRGSRVHAICESIMTDLGEFDIDDVTRGYITSFKKWFDTSFDIVEIEKRFFDDELLITGQCDLIMREDSGLTIVDFKTSYSPSKTWPLQGSAYAYLARKAGYDIQKVKFIKLSKNGEYPQIFEYPIDIEFFMTIFKVYKHFFEDKNG